MSAPRKLPDAGLTDEAARLIADYFARIRSALPSHAPGDCEAAVEDLRAHVFEDLAGGAGVAFVCAGLAAALLLPFALRVILSRIGRAAEQKRDLEVARNKGGIR